MRDALKYRNNPMSQIFTQHWLVIWCYFSALKRLMRGSSLAIGKQRWWWSCWNPERFDNILDHSSKAVLTTNRLGDWHKRNSIVKTTDNQKQSLYSFLFHESRYRNRRTRDFVIDFSKPELGKYSIARYDTLPNFKNGAVWWTSRMRHLNQVPIAYDWRSCQFKDRDL